MVAHCGDMDHKLSNVRTFSIRVSLRKMQLGWVLCLCWLIHITHVRAQCPEGWTHAFQQCYKYFIPSNATETLSTARSLCDAVSAKLAMPNSQEENDLIFQLSRSRRYVVIGGFDEKKEGVWLRFDGVPIEHYTNWQPGKPNGFLEENCLHIWSDSKWNDIYCVWKYGTLNGYICQKSTDPPPRALSHTLKLRARGKKIALGQLASESARSLMECALLCGRHPDCLSVNVCWKNDSIYKCEILNADITNEPIDMVGCNNYYVATRNPAVRN